MVVGPYLHKVPLNPFNQKSIVVDGDGTAPASTEAGFIYDYAGGSSISGVVDGRVLKFSYDQPDGERGSGTFELTGDARSFAGTWQGGKAGAAAGGAWSATRVVPVAGRTWLVVLEANWERDLEEELYGNYHLVQAIQTPFDSTRLHNGEVTRQRYVNQVRYNTGLADSLFSATVTYDPNAEKK